MVRPHISTHDAGVKIKRLPSAVSYACLLYYSMLTSYITMMYRIWYMKPQVLVLTVTLNK